MTEEELAEYQASLEPSLRSSEQDMRRHVSCCSWFGLGFVVLRALGAAVSL